MTDEARHYVKLGQQFAGHGHTNHGAGEYVSRFNPKVHTNTVEGFFSIFKRGMRGVYQHASKRHLHRYLAEFDFRYSNRIALGVNDVARADTLLAGVVGKRSPIKQLVGKRDGQGTEEAAAEGRGPGGVEEVPRPRSRVRSRWRPKPHRRRGSV